MTPSKTDAKDEQILSVLEKEFGSDGATATDWQRACLKGIAMPHKTFHNRLSKLRELERIIKEGDGQGAVYRVKREPVPVPNQCQSDAVASPEAV